MIHKSKWVLGLIGVFMVECGGGGGEDAKLSDPITIPNTDRLFDVVIDGDAPVMRIAEQV